MVQAMSTWCDRKSKRPSTTFISNPVIKMNRGTTKSAASRPVQGRATRDHITVYAHSRIMPTCSTSCWGLLLNGTGTSAPDFLYNVAEPTFLSGVWGCKHGFVGHECMLFGVRWLPDTKGEYAIAARMVDNAAGQMTVCIPMVMLGYFQPTL